MTESFSFFYISFIEYITAEILDFVRYVPTFVGILSQLYGIQTGDKGSEAYLNRIKEETGKTEQEIREAASIALGYMLHDYSRFRVETIDSFFQSVMRNLARELELSPNLNIELNNTEVLSEAVDSMIEKLGPTSPVLAWLLDYINERIADGSFVSCLNTVQLTKNTFFHFCCRLISEGYGKNLTIGSRV